MDNKKILVIDDDRGVCDLVAEMFSRSGAFTYAALNGQEGLRQFHKQRPDLVLLDLKMPGMSGFEVLQLLRMISNVPIIILSAIASQEEMLRCLDAGADDYVTKPYDPRMLLARSYASMRRGRPQRESARISTYDDGYLMFDLGAHVVRVAEEEVRLSATEFALLSCLAHRAGRVCTFRQILENVWGGEVNSSEENIHTFVYQLRQKLEPDPQNPKYIISVRSVGYQLRLLTGV